MPTHSVYYGMATQLLYLICVTMTTQVLRYVQTLLRSYAARFRGPVAPPTAEDVRVRSAADVRRLVHLCDCRGGRAKDSVRACLAAVPNPWRCGRMIKVPLLAAAHAAIHCSRSLPACSRLPAGPER